MRSRPWRGTAVCGMLMAASLVAGCSTGPGAAPPEQDPPTTTGSSGEVDRSLTFGVFGPQPEIAAYASLVSVYNSLYDDAEMVLESYPSRRAFVAEVRETGELPDVFLTSEEDLAWLENERRLLPVDELLIERGVDFGDLFSRDAVFAFSSESRLQCLPVGISPKVIYYNTDLVDFDAMALRGLPVPGGERTAWNFEEFTAAAEFASRPGRGTRAFHVDASIEGLAPWLYAAGGEVYDEATAPTSLAFSSDETRSALETVLPVLRDQRFTLTDRQLERRPPLAWFRRGKLAMVAGYRDLVPQLRQVAGLEFDVIQMPSIERTATIGDLTGMCISAETENVAAAADFLVHMSSSVSVRRVATEGYLVPANLEVALSQDFLQPGRAPDHAQVFTGAVRDIVLPPLVEDMRALEEAVADALGVLLTAPVLGDLELLTQRIDVRSRTVLGPDRGASEEGEESAEPTD